MAKVTTMSSLDKQWQAESDARTMAEYQAILDDPKRRTAAMKAAKNQAADLQKRASAMSKVAGTKTASKKKK